jgi:two-component system CAI-1 autoinducer sensor kinase/phosphatase CqsS
MLQLSERLLPKRVLKTISPSYSFAPTKFVQDCVRRYVEYHAHAQRKIRAAAFIGVFGFPIFYFVWAYVLPQPYESIPLRAIGAGLCLLLALAPWWPPATRAYVVPFSYFTFLYCLPFFFTLMLLFNHSNAAWQMSTLAALIYVVLLYDLVNSMVVLVIGSAAAVVAYHLATQGAPIPEG